MPKPKSEKLYCVRNTGTKIRFLTNWCAKSIPPTHTLILVDSTKVLIKLCATHHDKQLLLGRPTKTQDYTTPPDSRPASQPAKQVLYLMPSALQAPSHSFYNNSDTGAHTNSGGRNAWTTQKAGGRPVTGFFQGHIAQAIESDRQEWVRERSYRRGLF